MGSRAYVVVGLSLVLSASAGVAQQHEEVAAPTLGPSGEAYLDATQFRGLARSVAYLDPTRPLPPLETGRTVGQEEGGPTEVAPSGGRAVVTIAALAVLAAILYAVVTSGARFSVSLSRGPEGEGRRRRDGAAAIARDDPPPAAVGAILSMADRKAALLALCRSLLAGVMSEQGILLDRSWTDRDTLRRVPRAHPQWDELQALVFASERVQFGGRDVTEEEFRGHVDRLRPLWRGAVA